MTYDVKLVYLITGAVIYVLSAKFISYFFYLVSEYEFDKVRRLIMGPNVKTRQQVLDAVEAYTLKAWVVSFMPEKQRRRFMESLVSMVKLAQMRVEEPTPEGVAELLKSMEGKKSNEKPSA